MTAERKVLLVALSSGLREELPGTIKPFRRASTKAEQVRRLLLQLWI